MSQNLSCVLTDTDKNKMLRAASAFLMRFRHKPHSKVQCGMRIQIGNNPIVYTIFQKSYTPGKFLHVYHYENGERKFEYLFDVKGGDIHIVTGARFWRTIRAATRLLALHHESVVRANHPKEKEARGEFDL